jgi:hypothetical protein
MSCTNCTCCATVAQCHSGTVPQCHSGTNP